MTTLRSLLALGAVTLLLGCETDPPPRYSPPPKPVEPEASIAEQLVSAEGWKGLRLGEPLPEEHPLYLKPKPGGKTDVLAGPRVPERFYKTGIGTLNRLEKQYYEISVYADADGKVQAVLLGGVHRRLETKRVPKGAAYHTRRYSLHVHAQGERGISYRLIDGAIPSHFALLACVGPPNPDLFYDRLCWSTGAGPLEKVQPKPVPAPSEDFATLLEQGDYEGAARALAQEGFDAARADELYRRGGEGPYALCADLLGSKFKARSFANDHSGLILHRLWGYFWRLARDLEQGEIEGLEWEILFAMLEFGLPVHNQQGSRLNLTPSIREWVLAPDHTPRVEAIAKRAGQLLYAAYGERYADRLTHLLCRTKWKTAERKRLFFDSLPAQAEAGDLLAAQRAQAKRELDREWRYGGYKVLDAIAVYLTAVEGAFPSPAAFEAARREVLLRLAKDTELYADYVKRSWSLAPAERRARFVEWLPEGPRQAIEARLASLERSAQEVAEVTDRFRYKIAFDKRIDRVRWWRHATVRDGLNASRFEAAERGAAILADYYRHLDQANAGGEAGNRDVFRRKELAARSYVSHYGAEASALFLCFSDYDFGRPALESLPPSYFAHVFLARRAGYSKEPNPGIGRDANSGWQGFAALVRSYIGDTKAQANPIARLLQDRYLRQLAKRYFDAYGKEAYLHVFLNRVFHLCGAERANRWCNYGILQGSDVRARTQSATVTFQFEGQATFEKLELSGPAEVGQRFGNTFAVHPRPGGSVTGTYTYSAQVRLPDGRRVDFTNETVELPDVPEKRGQHRLLTVSLGTRSR